MRYRATIFTIVLTMNRGIDYWVTFHFIHLSSLHLKMKFMEKNWSHMIVLTWRKQVPITYISLGLLQRNNYFQTPLEQVNKMISRFLLLLPSFTHSKIYGFFSTLHKYSMFYTTNLGLYDCVLFLQTWCYFLPNE